jgi:hypothetical protein
MGFTSGNVPVESREFLLGLRRKATERTRCIVERVNDYLEQVKIDFDKDAVPLTPSGNVTERHVCEAYYRKAEAVFKDISRREEFWADKLDTPDAEIGKIIDDPVNLQGLIRKKTMKAGGAGYVEAAPESFPLLSDMNEFILSCGAIPSIAWLNGESGGEADPDKLIELHKSYGAAAIGIVPDRNWNFPDPDVKKKKVNELNKIIETAKKHDFPIFVGTEMNAPGLKHVDDFSSDALKPHVPEFIKGAAIASAHTVLQPAGMGYLSSWAKDCFSSVADKNKFFTEWGKGTPSACFEIIREKGAEADPAELLGLLNKKMSCS